MLDGTQSGATLAIDGIVHIGATLALSDNSRNLIEGLTSNARLTINHYLTGAGTIATAPSRCSIPATSRRPAPTPC